MVTASHVNWLKRGTAALILAPMEGVTDAPMRALMTERGGFSFCVSEFFRVSQDVPHSKVFFHHVPEARAGWRTEAGTPVQLQLLGGDPEKLAEDGRPRGPRRRALHRSELRLSRAHRQSQRWRSYAAEIA